MQEIIQPPAFQRPSGKLYLSAPQLNLIDMMPIKVLFDAIAPNYADGIEDLVNNRITITLPGFYDVVAHAILNEVIADKAYAILIYLNGLAAQHDLKHSSNVNFLGLGYSLPCYLDTGDFLEVFITSYAGADTVDVYGGVPIQTFLAVQRVR